MLEINALFLCALYLVVLFWHEICDSLAFACASNASCSNVNVDQTTELREWNHAINLLFLFIVLLLTKCAMPYIGLYSGFAFKCIIQSRMSISNASCCLKLLHANAFGKPYFDGRVYWPRYTRILVNVSRISKIPHLSLSIARVSII